MPGLNLNSCDVMLHDIEGLSDEGEVNICGEFGNVDVRVKKISKNYWPTFVHFDVSLPTALQSFFHKVKQHLEGGFIGQSLVWQHFYGSVELEVLSAGKNITVSTTPVNVIVLFFVEEGVDGVLESDICCHGLPKKSVAEALHFWIRLGVVTTKDGRFWIRDDYNAKTLATKMEVEEGFTHHLPSSPLLHSSTSFQNSGEQDIAHSKANSTHLASAPSPSSSSMLTPAVKALLKPFVVGMLTNLGEMSCSKVTTLLSQFCGPMLDGLTLTEREVDGMLREMVMEDSVAVISGVIDVDIYLKEEYAMVRFDPRQVELWQVISVIQDCGFEAFEDKEMEHGSENQLIDLEQSSPLDSNFVQSVIDSSSKATSPTCQSAGHPRTIVLTIQGMTCASCVHSIETALKSQPGVLKAAVALLTERAEITYDTGIISSDQSIAEVVNDAGFEASVVMSGNLERTVRMQVLGMTCASCVASIESALKSRKGVSKVSVQLLSERAEVSYDPKLISSDKEVADVINDAGFEATIISVLGGALVSKQACNLQIFGMHCASCVGKIEREVPTLKGVLSCRVDLLRQNGVVEFDPAAVGVRDVVAKIESIGFNALVISTGSVEETGSNVGNMTAEEATNSQIESLKRTREIQKWRRLFWMAFGLGLPVMVVSMLLPKAWTERTALLPGLTWGTLIMGILTAPIQFGVGRTFYESASRSVTHGTYTMDVLVVLGTSVAFFFSVLQVVRSVVLGLQPPHIPEVFFETSATLITFVTLGRYLENVAKAKTSDALAKLMSLAPTQAIILVPADFASSPVNTLPSAFPPVNMVEKTIPAELLQQGDIIKVIPGERLPSDGVVEHGHSSLDESMITGESIPVEKSKGESVIAGTLNQTGLIWVKATRVGRDTTLQQILKLVGESQGGKQPIQDIADMVAGYFVPGVITLSFKPGGGLDSNSGALYLALKLGISVVIVACPCALGLATPTAIMVGTGVGARLGILIKGGRPLSVAHKLTTVVFDKTGTLTEGKMTVQAHVLGNVEASSSRSLYSSNSESWDISTVMRMVELAEGGSEHPIGKALCRYAGGLDPETGGGKSWSSQSTSSVELEAFEAIPGSGVSCIMAVRGRRVRLKIGSLKFVEGWKKADSGNLEDDNENETETFAALSEKDASYTVPKLGLIFASKHQAEGRTVVFAVFERLDSATPSYDFLASFAISDTIRSSAKSAVQGLQRLGLKVVMITGDHALSARSVASQVGIKDIHSGISPAGKRTLVRRLQEKGACVAMVGDGINDSASIAQSDLGVSLGGATDVAVEAADVVIMRDDLRCLVTAIDLCRKITRRIVLNFVWATS
ncbi:hypothetical protein HDU97_000207 [Phlyctochytrium planicorne]|nr:hypothetical protein HDU97_000207 [Phlyctochytrium planicorne]